VGRLIHDPQDSSEIGLRGSFISTIEDEARRPQQLGYSNQYKSSFIENWNEPRLYRETKP
jgi:hypothetical protein